MFVFAVQIDDWYQEIATSGLRFSLLAMTGLALRFVTKMFTFSHTRKSAHYNMERRPPFHALFPSKKPNFFTNNP